MEQVFAFKKESAVFRFFQTEDKDIVLKIEGNTSIAPSALFNFLLKKGLKQQFIDKNGIVRACTVASTKSDTDSTEEILVARSQKPVPSDSGKITFDIQVDTEPFLNPGTYIGQVEFPNNGEDGIDPYGNPIPYPNSTCDWLNNMVNIVFNQENNKLFASIDGHFVIRENQMMVLPDISIDISNDKTKAFITLCTKDTVTVQDLMLLLSQHDINYGVDQAVLNILAMKTKVKKGDDTLVVSDKTQVALGREPIKGKDGYIEWLVNIENEVQFEEDAKGNINFKETNIIKSIEKGKTIAILHPHKNGTDGIGVDAKAIPAPPVHIPKLAAGKGVMVSDDGTIFISEVDGMIAYKNNGLSIAPLYKVEGHVDFSTGNIQFEGSVDIDKDILSGFSVSALQDIVIKGAVEGAMVDAGASVNIKGGVAGQGKARINAGMDLIAKYTSETQIVTGGNLIVENSINDSKVVCYGSIIASNSGIVGGNIFANRGILCKNMGSSIGVQTNIIVGGNMDKYRRYVDLTAQLDTKKKELADLENDIMLLQNDKKQLEMLAPELEKLKETITDIEHRIEQISHGFDLKKPVYKIAVLNKIYGGVTIHMADAKMDCTRPITGPVLLLYNHIQNKISVRNLQKKEILTIKKQFNKWLEQEETIVD